MNVYELQIQTEDELISETVEVKDFEALKVELEKATTVGISIVYRDKTGKWIPGHAISKVKWRKTDGTT